jgi:hypothetical protein
MRSGALTDVWPATIAPTLVADDNGLAPLKDRVMASLTGSKLGDDFVDGLRFYGVNDEIRGS